jgi:uncharacterized protein (DUF2252 family)
VERSGRSSGAAVAIRKNAGLTDGLAIAPEEPVAKGKALRKRFPLKSQSDFQPAAERDPIGVLQATDADRLPELLPIRYGRMLTSPFTFFRGAAAVMAADLAKTAATGVYVQACGDCHLKNFGAFATPERNLVFDINDFDETLPAPWEWDVKRLATSFVVAARDNGLPEKVAKEISLACAGSYRKSVRTFAQMNPLDLWYARFGVDELLAKAPSHKDRVRAERRIENATSARGGDIDYPKLAEMTRGEVHIRESPPLIFHPEARKSAEFESTAREVLEDYRKSLSDDRRLLFDRYHFVDAAIKVVGIGSVGTRCWIVLLMSVANEPLFLQFKQANTSVFEPYAGKSAYEHHGERVVKGQRLMQASSDIFLGWTTGPNANFYVRQLRDAKIGPNVEAFDVPMFQMFARACGSNLARAHAKTSDAAVVSAYLGKGADFDDAIARFAKSYADQTERDHARLKAAVKKGRIAVFTE